MLVPTDIRYVWSDIKDRVTECLAGQDMTPEEIYHMCRSGNATLMMAPDGLAVFQVQESPSDGDLRLVCLIGHGEGEAMSKYLEQGVDLAQRAGCSKLMFISKRIGFERKLGPKWKRKYTMYEMEV